MRRRRHDNRRSGRRAIATAATAGASVADWARVLDRHGCIAPEATARALHPDRALLADYLAADPLTQATVANDLALDETST